MDKSTDPFPSLDWNLFEGRECVFVHHLNPKTYQTYCTNNRKYKRIVVKDIKGETFKKEYLLSNVTNLSKN